MTMKIDLGQSFTPTELQKEGRKVWQDFQEISAQIPGFNELKQSGLFYSIDGAEDGTNLYTYFPFLFAETFPELSDNQLHKLSLMGLLYLYHILIDDALMDQRATSVRAAIVVSNAYNLKALNILDDLLGTQRLPWIQIDHLHQSYGRAILLEGRDHTGVIKEYRDQDLFEILSSKSSLAKLIILGLCRLSNREENIEPLQRSFDLYYLGDQMFDDFRDWRADLKEERYSYLLTRLITAFNLRDKVTAEGEALDAELVGKHLYFSGMLNGYLDEIIDYWEQAKACVVRMNCPRWVCFINTVQLAVSGTRSALADNSRRLLLQREKYDYELALETSPATKSFPPQQSQPGTGALPFLPESVVNANQKAVQFFHLHYQPETGFKDFIVFNEPLPVWVSAYVGCALTDWRNYKAQSDGPHKDASSRLLDRIASRLVALQTDMGWSANKMMPEDADTTGWVMNFLIEGGHARREVLERGTKSLLKYQQQDGGFCTYLPGSIAKEFTGWAQSHIEVTALALEVVIKAGFNLEDAVIRRGINYLKRARGADSLWPAYWWDSKLYSTYQVIRALNVSGERMLGREAEQMVAAILGLQWIEGNWGQDKTERNKVFETALAVKTLLMLDERMAESAPVERAIVWLLTYQGIDGSWDSEPMMRVPDGHESRPWMQKDWRLDLPNGFGTLVRDQNRFFTTATALSALCIYLQSAGNRRLVSRLKCASG